MNTETDPSLIKQLAEAIYNDKTKTCDICKLDAIINEGVNVNGEYKNEKILDRLIRYAYYLDRSNVKVIFNKLVEAGIDVLKSEEVSNSFAYAFECGKYDYMMCLLYEASPEICKKYICEGGIYEALNSNCDGGFNTKFNFLLEHGFEMNFKKTMMILIRANMKYILHTKKRNMII